MKARTILVTGATGTTGKLVVDRLASRGGFTVRAAVRSPEKARKLLSSSVETVEFDYRRPDTVAAAMKGVDRLYLLTPGGSEQVEQTWVAVDAARSAGVERIVRLGSLQAQDRGHVTQVERWCKMTEEIVERSGIPATFLRPTWFDQDFTELYFAPQVKAGFILLPAGEGLAGWVDCRDIADMAVVALTEDGHEGRAYTPTGPELIGMREIVAILSTVARRTIRYFDVPEAPQRWMARFVLGLPPRDVDAMVSLMGKLRAGHLTHVNDDVERVTGKKATSFARFAEDNAALLRR